MVRTLVLEELEVLTIVGALRALAEEHERKAACLFSPDLVVEFKQQADELRRLARRLE